MKNFKISFIVLAMLISTVSIGQINKVIIDDQTDLLTEVSISKIDQELRKLGLEVHENLNYEKRCEYLFFYFMKEDQGYKLSARDCERNAAGSASFNEDLRLADDLGIGSALAASMKQIIDGKGTSSNNTNSGGLKVNEFVNHHDSRYFFAPSAYNLKRGQLYYNTAYFLVHHV